MSPSNWTNVRTRAAGAVALCAMALAMSGCAAEVWGPDPGYPVGTYDGCMTDAYVATNSPVYYDGRASYYCGNAWYYRDGGRWAHYDREPLGLRDRRFGGPGARQYERPRGGSSGRGHGGGGRR